MDGNLRGVQGTGIDLNPRRYTAQGSSGLLIDAYTRGKAIGAYATREGTLRYKITVHVELQALAVTNAHKVYPLLSGHRRVKSCPIFGVNEKFQSVFTSSIVAYYLRNCKTCLAIGSFLF